MKKYNFSAGPAKLHPSIISKALQAAINPAGPDPIIAISAM